MKIDKKKVMKALKTDKLTSRLIAEFINNPNKTSDFYKREILLHYEEMNR